MSQEHVCISSTFMIRFSFWKTKLGDGYKIGCLPLLLLWAKQNLATYTQKNIAIPQAQKFQTWSPISSSHPHTLRWICS